MEEIENFCIQYEEDYRVDFIRMVGINLGRLCDMTEEDIYELIEQNIRSQAQSKTNLRTDRSNLSGGGAISNQMARSSQNLEAGQLSFRKTPHDQGVEPVV